MLQSTDSLKLELHFVPRSHSSQNRVWNHLTMQRASCRHDYSAGYGFDLQPQLRSCWWTLFGLRVSVNSWYQSGRCQGVPGVRTWQPLAISISPYFSSLGTPVGRFLILKSLYISSLQAQAQISQFYIILINPDCLPLRLTFSSIILLLVLLSASKSAHSPPAN